MKALSFRKPLNLIVLLFTMISVVGFSNQQLKFSAKIITINQFLDNDCNLRLLTQKFYQLEAEDSIRTYYHRLSSDAYKKKDYKQALFFVKKEDSVIKILKDVDKKIYNEYLYLAGKIYYRLQDDEKTLSLFKKVKPSIPSSAKIYSFTAFIYKGKGELDLADDYYNKAIFTYKKENNIKKVIQEQSRLANVLLNYQDNKHSEEGIELLEGVLNIINKKQILIEDKRLFNIYNSLGILYNLVLNKRKAIFYYKKALKLAFKLQDKNRISLIYHNLANIYRDISYKKKIELNKSMYFYKKSLEYNSKLSTEINISIGVIYYLKEDYLTALSYYDSVLKELFGINYISKQKIPTKQEIESLKNHQQFERLTNEIYYSYIRLYKKTKQSHYLKKAIAYAKLQDYTYDIILEKVQNKKSKLHWQSKASAFYTGVIEACYEANDNVLAFYFMEKNKALLLLINSEEKKLKLSEHLPLKVYHKEKIYRKAIASATINYKKAIDSLKEEYADTLFQKKQTYSFFLDSIKVQYPEISLYEQNISMVNLQEVQDSILDDNSVLVSYIWNDKTDDFDALYTMLTTKTTSNIYKIKDIKNFRETLDTFRKIITKPFTTTLEKKEYQKLAFQLYSKLFPTIAIREQIKNKKLIIIPDNNIQQIPFEALITQDNSSEYLIYSSEIVYEYSMSFLKQNKQLKRQSKYDVLGIAPVEFSNKNLEKLPYSKDEINKIRELFTGKFYLKNDATKQHFLKEINNAKMIHLATHAESNDKIEPWIAFNEEKLYLDELYLADNQAELAVLSACNTSMGDVVSGEGVMSLARGFFYSGTNSVVSSLWNTDDKATVSIIDDFYQNLKNKKTKSFALREAKLNYLKTSKGSESSPYYWANLILIGNNDAISFIGDNTITLGSIVFAVIMIFFSAIVYKRYVK